MCGDQASLRLTLGCRARGRLRRDGGVARGLKWGWVCSDWEACSFYLLEVGMREWGKMGESRM